MIGAADSARSAGGCGVIGAAWARSTRQIQPVSAPGPRLFTDRGRYTGGMPLADCCMPGV